MPGVDTLHGEYIARIDEWQTLRDVLAGSRAVKAAGERYLPALAGQKYTPQPGTGKNAYDNYLLRTKFYAATARTQQALGGIILHKNLVIEGPDALVEQLKDVTLNDTPIEDFADLALSEVIGLGRFGILVDMPDDEEPNETRPYWVGYTTEQMVNWRTTSSYGDTYLTMMVLKEVYETQLNDFETKCHDQYRVLRLVPDALNQPEGLSYVQDIYQKISEKDKEFTRVKTIVPMKLGKPLPFIPFVTLAPTTLSPSPEKPPLSEMAETNLHMYRRSADLEHGRHITGLPTPVVTGAFGESNIPPAGAQFEPLTIGSSQAWMLAKGAEVKYLEFTGQGLGALVEGMREDKEEMAQLGSEMFASDQATDKQETATAVRVRHSSKTASLKTIARRTATAFSKAMRMQAWWSNFTEDLSDETISATLDTRFVDTEMTPEKLKALVLAVQAGAISGETMYAELEKGELTRPGVTWEQEKATIDSEAEAAAAMAADEAALMAEAVPPAPVVKVPVGA